MTTINLTVNGRSLSADVEPRTHLADLLRETHNLTGTHLGCEHGVCGACTLLVDGEPTRSCITYAVACENAKVTTIEGLDEDEIASELRRAFQKEHGLQCGYCTPGMIVSARDVVLRLADPTEREIRVAMSGNLCRCTGYVGITRAIQSVIADRRARGIPGVPAGARKRLGPTGSGHAASAQASAQTRAKIAATTRVPAKADRPSALAADFKPQSSLSQSFTVSHPADEVWAFFGDVEAVASCLPGAALTSVSDDGHVEGGIKVKVGPISAAFQGVADVTRDDAGRSGVISGTGKDAKSNSATRGVIRYKVREADDGAGTRVDVDVGFTLTGMLAQFGRSGLVQDVANRLTAAFVANLEAKLAHASAGGDAPAPPIVTELDAGSLAASVVKGWFAGLFGKLFRRKPRESVVGEAPASERPSRFTPERAGLAEGEPDKVATADAVGEAALKRQGSVAVAPGDIEASRRNDPDQPS